MAVTIERCDTGERAEAIQDLFRRNNRQDFPAVYARGYRWWMERGAASWVGLDETGGVVLHVAAFPRDFVCDGQRLQSAVLGDLMADPAHRNFWAPMQLLRTAVADIAAANTVDFLISDPTPPSAGLLCAAGFTPLGTLRRLMLPLARPYLAFGRMRTAARALQVEYLTLDDPRVDDLLCVLKPGEVFRVARTAGDVATKVPGDNFARGGWMLASDGDAPVALALVSDLVPRLVLMVVDLVWSSDRVSLASVAHAIAGHARDRGFSRLGVSVLERTRAATELSRAGFLGRADTQPFVIRTLRAGLNLPKVDAWWISPLDGSAW